MLDLSKVIVLFSTSNVRVNVAPYCLLMSICPSVNIGYLEGDCLVFTR